MRRPDATLAVAAAMGLLAALGDACGQTSMDGAFATAFSAALSKDPDYRAARYELVTSWQNRVGKKLFGARR